ncbi:MAG TPA: alpha-2-macroglobulin family protein, partial [Pyrinomonadaceae bacterium]|nr:alpha-2-macroglobulin family protein [Pyrinomonadaceae bacterium]
VQQTWERVEVEDEEDGGSGKYKRYESKLKEKELSSANVNTNANGEASYDYVIPIVGDIYVKTIVNENGKEIVASGAYIWSADRSNKWADFSYQDTGSIKLVLDKKSYKPGETAHVLAMLPTEGAHLLVTTELSSVMTAQHVEAKGRAVMFDVPIEARYAPNVYLGVTFVKDGEMYQSDKLLAVPARDKLLSIEVLQDKKEYKPRETASYTVLARNADGSPAPGAEVSLGVVDEAIYSIRPESAGDIRKEFYGRRYNEVQTSFSLSYYFSGYSGAKPADLAKKRSSYQLADFKNDSQLVEPTIRKEFKDTAFWQPDLVTGADGKATVKFQLPDNLTTWRATARAVTSDTRVGAGIGKVVSRKDVIMRLETPRFMTEGDTVTLSGVVHNYLTSGKATEISIEVTGAQLVGGGVQQVVTIPSQGEHRVDWKVAAGEVGDVRMLAKAKTDTESDGVELSIPVVPQGLRKSIGGAQGSANEEFDQTFDYNLPGNANPASRKLRIEVTPSVAGTLFGALDYLTSYPYGCTEQTMSSFLPNVVVAEALKNVPAASIRSTNNLAGKVRRGLDRLYSYQHDDGGWGWWKDDKTDPFMTAYVVDGLTMASRVGQEIDTGRVSRGRDKLRAMLDGGKDDDGKAIDQETRAYMAYALNESGEADARYVNALFNERVRLQPYGRALLALTLKKRGDDNRAREVAGEIERSARANEFDAHWESRLKPMLDFTEVNDTEATALSVKALAKINPSSSVLPKAARWLAANRRNGTYWVSTKQTAFAILGLTEYLKVSKELSPDYSLEVYLNGEQVLARRVTGADAANGESFVVERKGGAVAGNNQVRVVKRGAGMVYFSTAIEYFTKEDNVAPGASADLRLTREYLRMRVDESGDKPKWITEPLTGELRSGDVIVSRLTLEGARARYLMIEDPIPAGCEQMETVSGINLDYSDKNWSDYYSAREFRDQRSVLFINYFDGKATYQYAMRVQVPGDFRVAPARAEQMYQPTVQSNTANTKLSILERK